MEKLSKWYHKEGFEVVEYVCGSKTTWEVWRYGKRDWVVPGLVHELKNKTNATSLATKYKLPVRKVIEVKAQFVETR